MRALERAAANGDKDALHRLFIEHIRRGELNPVEHNRVVLIKQNVQRQIKEQDNRARIRGDKRLSPEQRKRKRLAAKRAKQRGYKLRHWRGE